jgi:pyrimidine-specific ribonucleoside hydrolase
MKLIIETDIGRDPDDYFALLYFISAGVDIKLICVSPGDPDQIAVAKFICERLGLTCPVAAGKIRKDKLSCSGFHRHLLRHYGAPLLAEPDGLGADLIKEHYTYDTDFFICGPLTSVGKALSSNLSYKSATMQGGFIGYDTHKHECPRLDKFEGKSEVPTFNLNGDIKGAERFLSAIILDRKFVSKNVCHTVIYDKQRHELMKAVPPKNLASEMLREGMEFYLKKHPGGKKFHDPTAAVCHLHPEVATWVRGDLYRKKGAWGTDPTWIGSSKITAALDYEKLWYYLAEGI